MISKTRIFFSIIGILFVSLGLNLLISCDFGMSSFDTTVLLISSILEISFSDAALYLHGVFIIIMLIYLLFKKIKFSEIVISFLSIFLITRCIDMLSYFSELSYDISLRIVVFIVGYILFCFGIVFTLRSNFIIAPVDKFIVTSSKIFKVNPGYLKIIVDLFLLTVIFVYSLKGDVDVTLFTVVITFGTGFIIKFLYPLFKGVR